MGKKTKSKAKSSTAKAADSKAPGGDMAAGGKTLSGKQPAGKKKSGGSARNRNPNLKLVKNENGPVASDNTAKSMASAKRRAAGADSAQGMSARRSSAEAAFPGKASAKKAAAKEAYPKGALPENPAGKAESAKAKNSVKKESAKKRTPEKGKNPSARRDSPGRVSGKKPFTEISEGGSGASLKKKFPRALPPEEVYSGKSFYEKASVRETYAEEDFPEETFSRRGPGKKRTKKKAVKKNAYGEPWEEDGYIESGRTRAGMGIGEWFIQHKSLIIIWFMVFAVLAGLVAAYYYIITTYRVTTVYVDGNVHYTNEEIMDMVMNGPYGDNSLYLAMKYKDKGVEDVPFVERMDVNILTPNMIRINVYEKALAGYVEYLGRYMYFDRDGIVVESSQEKTAGIPQVTGLQFGYVILNEALPVENDTIFKRILSITQLLDKYELSSDRIYFDSDYNLTLYFEGVRVTLGGSEEIDEKVMRLQYILPELAGKSGTLSMENYTEDSNLIPFHQD